jgi:hypothetical protein
LNVISELVEVCDAICHKAGYIAVPAYRVSVRQRKQASLALCNFSRWSR